MVSNHNNRTLSKLVVATYIGFLHCRIQ